MRHAAAGAVRQIASASSAILRGDLRAADHRAQRAGAAALRPPQRTRRRRRAGRRRRAPYRFTVKLFPLLVPAAVLTVTLTTPNLAAAGTLHLIWVALQET